MTPPPASDPAVPGDSSMDDSSKHDSSKHDENPLNAPGPVNESETASGSEQLAEAAPRTEPGPLDDADPLDGRDETMTQRLDRNWNEILQELRVIQTGTQILTGFLLALAFQPRFAELDTFQLDVYLVLVSAAVAATILGLTPVSLHRELFRRGAKKPLVKAANVLLRLTLLVVAVVLVGTVLLVFDVVTDRTTAIVAASVAAVALLSLWLVLPLRWRDVATTRGGGRPSPRG